MHAYAALVRQRKDECGYRSWQELADAAGVSTSLISEIVNDSALSITRMPAIETVEKLARALRLSPDQLLVAAADAYGVPVAAPVTVHSAQGVRDSELAREMYQRAVAREEAGGLLEPLDLSGMARGAAQSIRALRRSLLQQAVTSEAESPDLARAQRHLAEVLEDALERAAERRLSE